MSRTEILEEMIDNWQGRLDGSRIAIIEKKTRYATDEELTMAVGIAIDTLRFPPIVKDMHAAITEARRKLGVRNAARGRVRYKPGDVIDGRPTFTPAEAAVEIEVLATEYPDAFKPRPTYAPLSTPEERRLALGTAVTRLTVAALRKCAALDPNLPVLVPTQGDLF